MYVANLVHYGQCSVVFVTGRNHNHNQQLINKHILLRSILLSSPVVHYNLKKSYLTNSRSTTNSMDKTTGPKAESSVQTLYRGPPSGFFSFSFFLLFFSLSFILSLLLLLFVMDSFGFVCIFYHVSVLFSSSL